MRAATRTAQALVALLGVLASAAASASPDERQLQRGEAVYARCAACHAIEGHRTGPQHCGLFGRRAGTAPGFADYSEAMRRSRIVWNEAELDAFLRAPMQRVAGTSMGYAGIADPAERADLIAWLRFAGEPGARCRERR